MIDNKYLTIHIGSTEGHKGSIVNE